jgi:hypothetical protein
MSNTRNRKPSRAVTGGAILGTPLAVLIGWAASKYAIPAEVIAAGAALAAQATSYVFRGGRRGEAD